MSHVIQLFFNWLCVLSLILSSIIILISFFNPKNELLVITGFVVFLLQGTMLTSSLFYSKNFSEYDYFSGSYLCLLQTILLNYAIISLHGLIACMMYDTWSQVVFWRSVPSGSSNTPTPETLVKDNGYFNNIHNFASIIFSNTKQNTSIYQPSSKKPDTCNIKKDDFNDHIISRPDIHDSRIPSNNISTNEYYKSLEVNKLHLSPINAYLLLSFGAPIFPTLILILIKFGWGGHICSFAQPYPFFCYISGSFGVKFFTFIGWCLTFSVPGLIFSFHLLYKMLHLREKNLRLGRTTYLTKISITKLAFSTFLYFLCVCFHLIPHLFFFQNDPEFPSNTSMLRPLSFEDINPYTNKYLCWWTTPCSPWNIQDPSHICYIMSNDGFAFFDDPRLAYFSYMRCPGPYSLIPSLIGIGFFLMFGFGKHCRQFYIRCWNFIRQFLYRSIFLIFDVFFGCFKFSHSNDINFKSSESLKEDSKKSFYLSTRKDKTEPGRKSSKCPALFKKRWSSFFNKVINIKKRRNKIPSFGLSFPISPKNIIVEDVPCLSDCIIGSKSYHNDRQYTLPFHLNQTAKSSNDHLKKSNQINYLLFIPNALNSNNEQHI